jgi:flagellar export protein FliJ
VFRFRLQKLLDYRLDQLEQARLALAKAEQALARRFEELDEASRERARLELTYRELAAEVTVLQLQRALAQTRAATAAQERARHAVLAAEQVRAAAHEQLTRCHRQARMLEKLRERRLAVHQAAIRAQERRAMDDVGGRTRGARSQPAALPAGRRR